MRIVAWNCCRGPMAKKLAALEGLQPDLAVISEALAPERESAQLLWFPSNASRLGIQVRCFGAYRLRRVKRAELPNCVVPLRISGPVGFNLLAVWTWPAPSYTQAFLNGLSAYPGLLRRGPTVVAGDFNGNPVFDKPTQRVKWWTTGFSRLHDAGLVSAYHEFNRVAFGGEPHATHHFLRKPERPFHIDYCFVPRSWAQRRLQVEVAHGPQWRLLSDHFPIVVDADPATLASAR
ncbi:MAG TPA: endonuclease/exonuclease/phosphatase family protein [Burkholderiaceae bacterium]|nr:endonuclease/exonuclease/phosphatase family protein [Burkholderiaceae bacterium]